MANPHPDTYTRNNSGHSPRHGHPYISGYWYLMLKAPEELGDQQYFAQLFNSTAESFSPPSRNISKEEIVGFGGIKKQLMVSQEESHSFSIGFRERFGLPVFNVINEWSKYINPVLGNVKFNYKGQCIVILAKPTFSAQGYNIAALTSQDIEEVFFFDGVFPESVPVDNLDAELSTNDTKVINVTFNYDAGFLTKNFDLGAFLGDFQSIIGDVYLPSPYLGIP